MQLINQEAIEGQKVEFWKRGPRKETGRSAEVVILKLVYCLPLELAAIHKIN